MVLDASEKGDVLLEATPVVVNCPIVQRTGHGALPGLVLPGSPN
jgi:hypothetical protein